MEYHLQCKLNISENCKILKNKQISFNLHAIKALRIGHIIHLILADFLSNCSLY
jgi:hypothetical protein